MSIRRRTNVIVLKILENVDDSNVAVNRLPNVYTHARARIHTHARARISLSTLNRVYRNFNPFVLKFTEYNDYNSICSRVHYVRNIKAAQKFNSIQMENCRIYYKF